MRPLRPLSDYPIGRRRPSDEPESGLAIVPAKDSYGRRAQPVFDDLGVDRAEVGLVVDVPGAVLEGGVLGIGVEVGRRAVEAAADAAAHHQHRARRAVIGALAAVLADPPAE